jgi:two-component system chemotaxis response regulator CheB
VPAAGAVKDELMGKVRVLVVDDSAFVRKALLRIFDAAPEIEVVGTARSGKEAIEKVMSLAPDVITLDVIMPGMDGLDTLKIIMESCPTPVLMLSQFTKQGADLTLRALEFGAMDFVDKSSTGMMDFYDLAREITAKVKTIAGSKLVRMTARAGTLEASGSNGIVEAVAVGASTGGPIALQMLLPKFPADIGFAVLVVQHMPHGFTEPLARRLDTLCAVRVKEAEEGDPITPGTAFIAPAGLHMTVREVTRHDEQARHRIRLGLEPITAIHRPSADVLFSSVAKTYGSRAIGVILTGMGADGAAGLKEMKEQGGVTLAQDEATSAIFGMPRVAIENGAADMVLPITSMAEEILKRA